MNANQPENRRILIVDDKRTIHDDFRKVLLAEDNGRAELERASSALYGSAPATVHLASVEIDSAFQGEEAVTLAMQARDSGRPYALAFVDVRMPPGPDGLETVARLWEQDPDLQVVLCTAFSDYSFEKIVEKLGRTDRYIILKKPFDPIEVRQLTDALLEKWRLVQATKFRLTQLEAMVHERTSELETSHAATLKLMVGEIEARARAEQANADLRAEMAERAKLEGAVALHERRLNAFFGGAVIGLVLLDAELRYLQVNETFAGISGVAAQDHRGRTLREIEPKVAPGMAPIFERVLETGRAVMEVELSGEIASQPGVWHHWIGSFFPLLGNGGTPEGAGAILVEITERKRAKAALEESEQRLQLALAVSFMGVWQWDLRTDEVYWSPECMAIMGPGWNERSLEAFKKMVHPEDCDRLIAEVDAAIAGRSVLASEFRFQRGDGVLRWLANHARAEYDAAGEPLRIVGTMRDITEAKRIEEQLRMLSRTVEQSPASVVVTDPQGNIEYVNPKFTSLTGYTALEVQGRNSRILKAGDLPTEHYARLWRTIRCGEEWRGELHNRKKNGELFWEQATISPLLDGVGNIAHFLAIKEDITERKRADELRQASDERFRIMFHSSPIPLANTTAEGRILAANNQFCDFFGYDAAAIIGRTTVDLGFWADLADRAPAMEKLRVEHAVRNHEARFRRKSGEVRTALLSLEPVVFGEGPTLLATIVDITERKALEAQLLRAQRVESVGRLASGIAHDMNNILAPIMMATSLLRGPTKPADLERTLTTIEISAKRGADLVKQLLTFGRGIEGKRGPIEPISLIREIVKIAAETFPKSIAITTRLAENVWPVRGDASQLHQVLLNLCVNARDAMPQGGSLVVGADNIEIATGSPRLHPDAKCGPYVRLRVIDTGTGIPAEIVDKIFDPFFTTKEMGKGTGLGLSTVIGVVKGHGGFLLLSSEANQGTTFEVYLPATPGAKIAIDEGVGQTVDGRGELILVVDDEEHIRTVLRETLTRHAYRVLVANDGAEASVVFDQNLTDIKLVITDIDMPYMNGVSLVKMMRRMRPAVKVITSTGAGSNASRVMDERRAELGALGVNVFLTKPYTADEILRAVRASLDEKGI